MLLKLSQFLLLTLLFSTLVLRFVAPPIVHAQEGKTVFGTIEEPQGVKQYNAAVKGDGEKIGFFIFLSNIIKLATVGGGIIVFVNFILAGFNYVTSNGDTGAHKKVIEQITNSVIGLVFIVMSYTVIAVISFVIFGRADYILNPQLSGPGEAITIPAYGPQK
jgi:hypothetical protein